MVGAILWAGTVACIRGGRHRPARMCCRTCVNQLAVEVSQVHIVDIAQRMWCNANGEATGRQNKAIAQECGAQSVLKEERTG